MADISTYQCSNQKCSFVVRLAGDFPLWHADTPKELRTPKVAPHAAKHLVRMRTETLCRGCQKVVELVDAPCPHCQAALAPTGTNHPCPRCAGVFVLTKLSVL